MDDMMPEQFLHDHGTSEGAGPDWEFPPKGKAPTADLWLKRRIQAPEPLLGEVITNTTRMFVGGPTGIGKTHFGMAMAAGLATGQGFAHWRASRRSRTLYVDGEMARDLMQERLLDLQRRMRGIDLSNLIVICREDYPELEPLNTVSGRTFLLEKLKEWQIEVVFFDNRMSLLSGDMKEETPWTETIPLVREITSKRVAQVWVDHTGHDTRYIYGSKTKEWQFDSVLLLDGIERAGADIAFQLKFTKARRRKPSNWADFQDVPLLLRNDIWVVENDAGGTGRDSAKLSPAQRTAIELLERAIIDQGRPATPSINVPAGVNVVSVETWRSYCYSGQIASSDKEDAKRKAFGRASKELLANRLVGTWNDLVWLATKSPERDMRDTAGQA